MPAGRGSSFRFERGLDKVCPLLTLENGSVLNDKAFELSADSLQTRLHVAACSYLIPLLHLLGTAGRAFGLANLQIGTWQGISRDRTVAWMSAGKETEKPLTQHKETQPPLNAKHRKHQLQQILEL